MVSRFFPWSDSCLLRLLTTTLLPEYANPGQFRTMCFIPISWLYAQIEAPGFGEFGQRGISKSASPYTAHQISITGFQERCRDGNIPRSGGVAPVVEW